MALIGYARVSTAEQDTALQTDALRKAGCERVFEDTVSGSTSERPGLSSALAFLREGDVLGVWRLDRLGRSLPHLIEVVAGLEARGVGGVVCGRGRNPTLRLWPTIFSGKIDVFPGDRRSRLISSMTSVAPA